MQKFDLIVLGAGSGGLGAAKRAASYGAKVAIVEGSRVGGTCVIRGCVPKKIMVYASQYGRHRLLAGDYGWRLGEEEFDWKHLVKHRNGLVDRLETIHEGNLERANVTLLRGWGKVHDANTVDIDGTLYQTDRILLSMGGSPVYPEGKGLDHAIISDGLFELEEMPKSAIVVGGGYIAIEFAGILQGLGCQVSLVARSSLLRGFDPDIADALLKALRQQGMQVYTNATIDHMTEDNAHHNHLHIVHEGKHKEIEADTALLFAIGRRPNTRGMGLEEVGVKLGKRGEILVDEDHNTGVPSIFAIGDVLDKANLTPVAIKAGRIFADTFYGDKPRRMRYDNIATAVFSQPPIGTAGLTEAQAIEKHGEDKVQTYRSSYAPLAYAATPEERKVRSLIKMVVHKETDRVLGIHMIGDDAPEIVQGFAAAIQAGATKQDLDDTVAIHPTQAEELVLMT